MDTLHKKRNDPNFLVVHGIIIVYLLGKKRKKKKKKQMQSSSQTGSTTWILTNDRGLTNEDDK